MKENSIKYHTLLALAQGDTPMTCAEIYGVMDDEYRPKAKDGEREWANITSHLSTLYAEHYVTRRKREARNKPFEYWLAAGGREKLRENDDLPDPEDGDAPMTENTANTEGSAEQDAPEPDAEARTVTCDFCERTLPVEAGVNPGKVLGGHLSSCPEKPENVDVVADIEIDTDHAHAEGETNLANPDAIEQDLGLEDPDVDSGRALAESMAGVVSTLRETEMAVDALRASAVTEGEAADIREEYNTDLSRLNDRLDTLTGQVKALSQAQARADGADSPFQPYIRRLKQLDDQGYGLYEGEIVTEYGGNVVEVRVKAKPRPKCRKKGPDAADGERVSVSKAAETVAEADIDPEYEGTDE